MAVLFFLALSAVANAMPSDVMLFVGTGNCDGEDPSCVEGPRGPEQIISPVLVMGDDSRKRFPDGPSMFVYGNENLFFPTPGAPVWLTTVGTDLSKGCIIATLADKSSIFAFGYREGSRVSHTVPSGGINPVFASVTEDQSTLLVANYHGPDNTNTSVGASVASFKIGGGCELTLVDVKNHSGHSVNPKRQGGAHVHSVVSVRGGMAYACDLGMDKIFTYKVLPHGKLQELARTDVKPGSGPRHLVQHPSMPYVYVVYEMGQSVSSFKQLRDAGGLEIVQTEKLSNEPGSKAAEIAISPCGNFIFATNRGKHNTVTVFRTERDGKIQQVAQVEAPAFPRGMALIGDGSMLVVGGQSQTEVWSYFVGKDGSLKKADAISGKKSPGLGLVPHPSTFTSFHQFYPEPVVV